MSSEKKGIVAIVTTDINRVAGGAPTFRCVDRNELQEMSWLLQKILDAAAHELNADTMILVKH